MGERMTSLVEALQLKEAINRCAEELELDGFDRSQIGAAMFGIGGGMCAARNRKGEMLTMIDAVRAVFLEEPTP